MSCFDWRLAYGLGPFTCFTFDWSIDWCIVFLYAWHARMISWERECVCVCLLCLLHWLAWWFLFICGVCLVARYSLSVCLTIFGRRKWSSEQHLLALKWGGGWAAIPASDDVESALRPMQLWRWCEAPLLGKQKNIRKSILLLLFSFPSIYLSSCKSKALLYGIPSPALS